MSSAGPPVEMPERRLERVVPRGWLGGVCAGLAEHTSVPVIWWRAAFVVLASWRLVGVFAYLLLWLVLPREQDASESPGLDAARRGGLRTPQATARVSITAEAGPALALVVVGVGLTWLVQSFGWGLSPTFFVIGALVAGSVGLVWWQADRPPVTPRAGVVRRWWRPLFSHWSTLAGLTVACIGMAVSVGLAVNELKGLGDVGRTLWAIGLSLAAIVILVAPWLVRQRDALAAAREARLLSDARADMAAHLHDSVLQTLALIQRQSHDPVEVARLARRQERELRDWLYGAHEQARTLAAALSEAAQEVEDAFPVRVECVTVGDAELTQPLAELVKAAREAMMNAAKHSGSPTVDVYAEVIDGAAVEVFVRDRGQGFDVDAIADDRLGVRGSIIERMHRHGGVARIRSTSETGTEVTLEMTP